jgi:nucleotide-binding universal stress UspA family protein
MDILVAVDGSEESELAIGHAADIADATGGSVTLAHVVDPAAYDTGGGEPVDVGSAADHRLILERLEDAEARGIDALEDAADVAADLGVDAETELLYGSPVEEVTDFAESGGFDAIFLGHRGRSDRAGLMLGSVAKSVVERATVPVTVVR